MFISYQRAKLTPDDRNRLSAAVRFQQVAGRFRPKAEVAGLGKRPFNEAVEKFCSLSHPAVNDMKYQGSNLKLNSGKRHGPLQVIDTSPRFLAVDLEKQLLPGSFEYAVHHLLEREFDLPIFDRVEKCSDALNARSAAVLYVDRE